MKCSLFFIMSLFAVNLLYAQSFSLEVEETTVTADVGSEIVFHIKMQNVSDSQLTLSIKRILEDHPTDWTSSFCFESCFAGSIDSISTDAAFGSSPLEIGDERDLEFHVFALNVDGTGNYQIEITDLRSGQVETVSLTALTTATSVYDDILPLHAVLMQNYPNPFNPSTKISYTLHTISDVELKVFDILGNEVHAINQGMQSAGEYSLEIDGSDLSSGVYIYQLRAGNFVATKKMILEK